MFLFRIHPDDADTLVTHVLTTHVTRVLSHIRAAQHTF